MAVAVIGCGAIGSIYAAPLTKVTEVWAYDIDAEHVAAIAAHGLRLCGTQEMTAAVKATTDPAVLADVSLDFALVAVKSVDTRQAARDIAPYLRGVPVVSMQNGLGNEEILAQELEGPVLRGVVAMPAERLGPGRVQQNAVGRTYLGPFLGGGDSRAAPATLEHAEQIGNVMRQGGLAVTVLADMRGAVWAKLITNSTLGPLRILLGMNPLELATSPQAEEIIASMMAEAGAVVEKLGVRLVFDPLYTLMRDRALNRAPHRGSLSHDFDAGRPTEIDFLTGALVAAGKRLGVPMPTCETVYQLFKGREAARAKPE